jgi:N,N'-diacetylchitobiose transport system permease protein
VNATHVNGAVATSEREMSRPRRPQATDSRRRRRNLVAVTRPWVLLAPSLVVMAGLLLWPLVKVGVLSLEDYKVSFGGGVSTWTGLDNYTGLLSHAEFWKTVLPNTVVFAFACVSITVVLGTLIALLLFRLGRVWRLICSSAIMAAWAMPAVTGTYVWVWLFAVEDGLMSRTFGALGIIDPATTNWFTDRLAFFSIATLNVVHHSFPFVAVTVLAGLLTIPKEMFEAGLIDGANAWQRFWQITVPTIRPVFLVVTILSTIWDFKVFTQIYLMPGGDGTQLAMENLGVYSYQQAFAQQDYGTGAASAVLLTIVLLVITVVYIRTLFRQGQEDL